jgi:hypothetical protein
MWNVEPKMVIQAFRDGLGERWTTFLDELIRAQGAVSGVADCEILTCQRTNIGDQGVDTQVKVPFAKDSTGRLAAPTCWQYKAEAYKGWTPSSKNKKLAGEINKPFAAKLIREGYAYRFCICDSLPAPTRKKWNDVLAAERDLINPNAPDPFVVTADDIASWVSRFLGLVRRFFRPELRDVWDLETWGKTTTEATPIFVPVAAWDRMRHDIARHVDLAQPAHDVVLRLQGEAGVGKTRGTYEELRKLAGAAGLVLYTSDERVALQVARQLSHDSEAHAILIADECFLQTQQQLDDALRAVRERVRVIAINNSGKRPPAEMPELWLDRLDNDTVLRILQENYPDVPDHRRRSYAQLSGGFVRFAAQLCRDDSVIAAQGLVAGAAPRVRRYLELAVRSDPRNLVVLQALSLVRRVGFRDEVAAELDDLCQWLGLEWERHEVQRLASALKDGPGFVAQAGRYFYVTPALIANAAFQDAWQYWCASDPKGFLQHVPPSLFRAFLDRVAEAASQEVQKAVSDFFRDWILSLHPPDLADWRVTTLVTMLADINPETHLPVLRKLIEASSIDDLRRVEGGNRNREWGPRRQIVWLAERMARFSGHYDDAERILLRLALAESEPRIGNNATHIWRQLYRILLSGTEVPFSERLARLEQRLRSGDEATVRLAFAAIEEVFSPFPMRMEGRPVVAGRVTPPDWQPNALADVRSYEHAVVRLVCNLAGAETSGVASLARAFLLRRLESLLAKGWLDDVRPVLDRYCREPNSLPALIQSVENFFDEDALSHANGETMRAQKRYRERIQAWLDDLRPKDLGQRIRTVVSRDFWRPRHDRAQWQQEIEALAAQSLENQRVLDENLAWLCTPEARGAFFLGRALGQLDAHAHLLDRVVNACAQSQSTTLGQGYVAGAVASHPENVELINGYIDELQDRAPQQAFELITEGGDALRIIPRLLRMVDEGKIPSWYLRVIGHRLPKRKLTPEEFHAVLERLSPECTGDHNRAREASLEFLYDYFHSLTDEETREMLSSPDVQRLVLTILAATAANPGRASWAWLDVIEVLWKTGKSDVIPLVVRALLGDDYHLKEKAEEFLARRALEVPTDVMNGVGEATLDGAHKIQFLVGKYDKLFSAMPVAAVAAWLNQVGVKGARSIARHLPAPFVDQEGDPRVPEVTAYVLERFEDDERVFEEFCAGTGTTGVYWTEGGKKRERDAEVAEQFLDHDLRRVREWARYVSRSARADAARERLEEEEELIH